MPMVPSLLAVGVYAAVKVGGYAAFAAALNRASGEKTSPRKFGVVKTLIGLAAGLTLVFGLAPLLWSEPTTLQVYIEAIPVRVVAWTIALALLYGFRTNTKLKIAAIGAGVAWSYALDGVMALLYKVLPGMDMPLC